MTAVRWVVLWVLVVGIPAANIVAWVAYFWPLWTGTFMRENQGAWW